MNESPQRAFQKEAASKSSFAGGRSEGRCSGSLPHNTLTIPKPFCVQGKRKKGRYTPPESFNFCSTVKQIKQLQLNKIRN